MSASVDSRYVTASLELVDDPVRGTHQALEVAPAEDRVVQFTHYQVRAGEQIDDLAHRYLGLGTLWWRIADINPEILDWTYLEPGIILRIPNG